MICESAGCDPSECAAVICQSAGCDPSECAAVICESAGIDPSVCPVAEGIIRDLCHLAPERTETYIRPPRPSRWTSRLRAEACGEGA